MEKGKKRREQMEEMLAQLPEDAFLRYALGLEHRGDSPERARQLFEENYRINPSYLPNYYQFADLLWTLGEREFAQEVFEAGIALAARQGETHTLGELKNAYMNFKIDED